VKAETKESIDRFVQYGIPPGHFLQAVLSNDLMEAMGRADSENRRDLFEICQYVYNELPIGCWGTKDKMGEWQEKVRDKQEAF
jgi:hypothetical protein